MTDVTDSYSADELRTGDVEQFTLSRERMRRMRVALVAEMRSNTPADPKGNRKMLHGALSLLAPDSSLRRKLARCGKRDPVNDLRWFCRRPSCGVCMSRQAKWLCKRHLWPSLQTTPPTQLRWITILTHQCSDLDDGSAEMQRQHRRLQRILAKLAISSGKDRTHHLRVWGAREVERIDDGWQFHVHMLVDLGGADVNALSKRLRTAWSGYRQVQTKLMEQRDHHANLMRLAHYMTKARYTRSVGNRREWLSNVDMVTLAQWRDRQSAQWHRFTWNVRGTSLD